ncbi:hypothetical protein [Streptomyces sp. 142MFCol3.1]|uniref:hypothetical protein n=1 Tax=Streptomyces sp. 142MFCol3.1 TaxID=1172179 RepID=UPI00041FF7FD|nr:hypothetical protein [Streptomyces sp. 142MFCol3.1]
MRELTYALERQGQLPPVDVPGLVGGEVDPQWPYGPPDRARIPSARAGGQPHHGLCPSITAEAIVTERIAWGNGGVRR